MHSSSNASPPARSAKPAPAAVTLRALRRADREPLARLIAATGAFTHAEHAVALELIDAVLSPGPDDDYEIVVAEVDRGRVAGYACYGPTPLTEGVYDLYWIAVDPTLQGRGVGRALLAGVEADLRGRAARMLLIETASKESYAATRAFYERSGYVELARVPDFYRAGDDKLIYGKRYA